MEVDTAASDELSGGSAVTGSPTVSADIQHLLLEAYSHIGEPDSLYGACHSNTSDEMRVRLYEHEGEWHKALSTFSPSTLYRVGPPGWIVMFSRG